MSIKREGDLHNVRERERLISFLLLKRESCIHFIGWRATNISKLCQETGNLNVMNRGSVCWHCLEESVGHHN